jgi:hypothetical protein
MFEGCSSLKTAPALPSNILRYYCYESMFQGCTSLTTAPELPAQTLTNYCYFNMFKGCSKIDYIKMLAKDISYLDCLTDWVSGVSTRGTFIKSISLSNITEGVSGIPDGWNIEEYCITPSFINSWTYPVNFNYNTDSESGVITPDNNNNNLGDIFYDVNSVLLSMTPEFDIRVKIVRKVENVDYVETIPGIKLWKATDTYGEFLSTHAGINITDLKDIAIVIVDGDKPEEIGDYFDFFTIEAMEDNLTANIVTNTNYVDYRIDDSEWKNINIEVAINVNNGQKIQFKVNGGGTFNITNIDKKFKVKGCLISLIRGGWDPNSANEFNSKYDVSLFGEVSSESTLNYLFKGCTTLQSAENLILPSNTIENCYAHMFEGCTALTTAPKLPATKLSNNCYKSMFKGCTSLTTSPKLSVMTLANNCFESMFEGCTSLVRYPELSTMSLSTCCYKSMFKGCKSLTKTPHLFSTTLADSCYKEMFVDCINLTNVQVKLPATTLENNCYELMFKNCTSLTTAPELPAHILADGCYKEMFVGCSKLNYVKMLALNTDATECLSNWLSGVASNGTFVKNSENNSLPSGESGIPIGWTEENEYEENE